MQTSVALKKEQNRNAEIASTQNNDNHVKLKEETGRESGVPIFLQRGLPYTPPWSTPIQRQRTEKAFETASPTQALTVNTPDDEHEGDHFVEQGMWIRDIGVGEELPFPPESTPPPIITPEPRLLGGIETQAEQPPSEEVLEEVPGEEPTVTEEAEDMLVSEAGLEEEMVSAGEHGATDRERREGEVGEEVEIEEEQELSLVEAEPPVEVTAIEEQVPPEERLGEEILQPGDIGEQPEAIEEEPIELEQERAATTPAGADQETEGVVEGEQPEEGTAGVVEVGADNAVASMTQFRAAVNGRAEAVSPPTVTAGDNGQTRIRSAGRRAANLIRITEQRVPASANAQTPSLPEGVTQLPEPTAENPVPRATQLIERASNRRLADQTPPRLQSSPRGNVPRLGQRPFPRSMIQEIEGINREEGENRETTNRAREGLRQLRQSLLRVQEAPRVGGEPVAMSQPVSRPLEPLPQQRSIEVADVFARLLTDTRQTATSIVVTVRSEFFSGASGLSPTISNLGEEELVPVLEPQLNEQLRAIAIEAGIAAGDLQAAIGRRRVQLAREAGDQSDGTNNTASQQREEINTRGQSLNNRISGEHSRIHARADAAEDALSDESSTQAINVRRDRLIGQINRQAAQQLAQYRHAAQTRQQEIDHRQREYIEAYQAVTQRDVFQLRASPPENMSTEDVQRTIRESEEWGTQRAIEVGNTFRGFRRTVREEVQGFNTGITDARLQALGAIRDWAASQDTSLLGWLTRFWDRIRLWSTETRDTADAWMEVQNQEAATQVRSQLDMIARLERAARNGISQQQILEGNRLNREQTAIVQAFFRARGEQGRRFDPIGIVAEGIRARVLDGRRTRLTSRIESMLREQASIDDLEKIGDARGPTRPSRVRERGNQIHHALHGGIFGMNEVETAMTQFNGLNSLQRLALEKYYHSQFEIELSSDLRSELSSGEFTRAQALMSGNQAEAVAAQLYTAMEEETIFGWGTDEASVYRALRNLTPELRDQVERIYQQRYGGNLRESLQEELDDIWTPTTHNVERAEALLDINVARADAIALDQALYFGSELGRRERAEEVYTQIANDVQAQAEREGWTATRMREELRQRTQTLTREYDERFANEPVTVMDGHRKVVVTRGSLGAGIDRMMTHSADRDLLNGLSEANVAAADAARIQRERASVFYASDTEINNVLESQYNRALEDTRRDLAAARRILSDPSTTARDPRFRPSPEVMALARQRDDLYADFTRRARAARPPWDENDMYRERDRIEQQIERRIVLVARLRSRGYMGAMTETYQERYQESVETVARENVQNQILWWGGDNREMAFDLIAQGGYLNAYQQIDYSERAGDGERMLNALEGLPRETIARYRRRWERDNPGRSFDDAVMHTMSGEHSVDGEIALMGRPESVDDVINQETQRVALQQDSGRLTPLVADPERQTMEYRLRQLIEHRERLSDPELHRDPDRLLQELGEFEMRTTVVQQATRDHRKAVEAATESIANAAAIAVALIIGTVGAIFTGGASAAVALAIIASLAATATTMGTRALFMGRAYGHREIYTDIAVGVVDAVVAGLTAGMGNRLLGIRQVATAVARQQISQQAKRQFLSRMRDFAVRQMARLGNVGRVAQSTRAIGVLERMAAKEAAWYSRLTAHAIAETIENTVQSIPSALTQSVLDEKNWEHGSPLRNILSSTGQQVVQGVAMGVGMSAGMSAGRRIWGSIRSPRLGVETHGMRPEMLTGAAREAHLREYLQMYPGRTVADFDMQIAREHAHAMKDYQQAGEYRGRVRSELEDALPENLRGNVSDVPITVLDTADFLRARGVQRGDAIIVVRNGQVHLVVRAGADPAVVREQARNIAEMVEPGTGGRTKNPADALPRDLRNRVPIEVNPDLEGKTVEVHYVEHNSIIIGVWIEVGPQARAIDIQMHVETARAMRRFQGIGGRVKKLQNRISEWTGRHGEPQPGDVGFETRLEVEKLPKIIQERVAAFHRAGGIESPEGMRIFLEIQNLEAQLRRFENVVGEMELEPGRGFVAAEGVGKKPEIVKAEQAELAAKAGEPEGVEPVIKEIGEPGTLKPQGEEQIIKGPDEQEAQITRAEVTEQRKLVQRLRNEIDLLGKIREGQNNEHIELVDRLEVLDGKREKLQTELEKAQQKNKIRSIERIQKQLNEINGRIKNVKRAEESHKSKLEETEKKIHETQNRLTDEKSRLDDIETRYNEQPRGIDLQKAEALEQYSNPSNFTRFEGALDARNLTDGDKALLRKWANVIEKLCEKLNPDEADKLIKSLLDGDKIYPKGIGPNYGETLASQFRRRVRREIIERVMNEPPAKQLKALKDYADLIKVYRDEKLEIDGEKLEIDRSTLGHLFEEYIPKYLEKHPVPGLSPIEKPGSLNVGDTGRPADGVVKNSDLREVGPKEIGEYIFEAKHGSSFSKDQADNVYNKNIVYDEETASFRISAGNEKYCGVIYIFSDAERAVYWKNYMDTENMHDKIHIAHFTTSGGFVFIR